MSGQSVVMRSKNRGSTLNKARANGLIEHGLRREADKASLWEYRRRLELGRVIAYREAIALGSEPAQAALIASGARPWQPPPVIPRPLNLTTVFPLPTMLRSIIYSRTGRNLTPAQSRRLHHKANAEKAREARKEAA